MSTETFSQTAVDSAISKPSKMWLVLAVIFAPAAIAGIAALILRAFQTWLPTPATTAHWIPAPDSSIPGGLPAPMPGTVEVAQPTGVMTQLGTSATVAEWITLIVIAVLAWVCLFGLTWRSKRENGVAFLSTVWILLAGIGVIGFLSELAVEMLAPGF